MIKVLVNTSPLLNSKAGIGYCVQNLVDRLGRYDDIEAIYSHKLTGVKIGKIINTVTKTPKSMLKDFYPERLAALAYNLVLSPFSLEAHSKIFSESRVDVDIYHETRHSVINSLVKGPKKPKLLVDIHDLSPTIYPNWHLSVHVEEVNSAMKSLLKADMFTVKSQFIKDEFVGMFGIDPNLVHVTPNAPGAAYHCVTVSDAQRQDLSARLKFDLVKPFILYTGTIEPRKNLCTLIEAFRSLRDRYEMNLVLAGGLGWHYHDIIEAVHHTSRNGDIILTGYLSETDFLYLYNLAHLYVYPSLYEGFGIPPLEAMSCGVPVIVADAASLPEVTGDAALRFAPGNHEELAYRIETVLENETLRNELRHKGFVQAGKFNWDDIVAQIVEIYRNMA